MRIEIPLKRDVDEVFGATAGEVLAYRNLRFIHGINKISEPSGIMIWMFLKSSTGLSTFAKDSSTGNILIQLQPAALTRDNDMAKI